MLSTATHFAMRMLPIATLIGCASSTVAPELLERMPAPPAPGTIGIRWLGTAGFEIRTPDRTLLIDPYLTRAPIMTLLFGHLEPDRAALAALDADLILIGHSHFDHLLDAPAISARTGAPILASSDACVIATSLDRARCLAAPIERRFRRDGFELTAIRASHGETLIGVPIDGTNDRPITRTPHVLEMRTGPVLIWVVRTGGVTIVHASTAGLPIDPLAFRKHVPEGADVLLLALALRDNSPGYTRHLIDALDPKVIIPHHPGLETDTLADPIHEELQETFEQFRKEEGERVQIPRPFQTIVYRATGERSARSAPRR